MCTALQIRRAYKEQSLRAHPDMLPPSAGEHDRRRAAANFQKLHAAYVVLSRAGALLALVVSSVCCRSSAHAARPALEGTLHDISCKCMHEVCTTK